MGYYKQQLIADQVEVGDRIPAPKPAASHVALNQRVNAPVFRTRRAHVRSHLAVTIAGVLLGVMIGVWF